MDSETISKGNDGRIYRTNQDGGHRKAQAKGLQYFFLKFIKCAAARTVQAEKVVQINGFKILPNISRVNAITVTILLTL